MTSPIFDTLTAEREATPLFESLARGLDDPMWSFETVSPPSTRDAVPAVATWPLRAVPR
ncbi:hypothetical protein [Frigoribacterium sp. RIT-PI-h]|uniref:hypothetical protein n=1 Tax=Frigoribacterium sp. RIT-PI-h TaxID=1690245 RepID=UPI000AC313CC|nr:hypothetical protein [Frigoribacterium sp. RIT-PI-h]